MDLFSLTKLAAIMAGSLCIAVGINCFLVPFRVLDGGIIGISLIINYLLGIPVGLVMLFCSLPIFLLAWIYDRGFFLNSLNGLVVSSITIDVLQSFPPSFFSRISLTPFSSAVIGGFIVGTGIGIMLRYDTSTGGTDLLAQFVSRITLINVGVIIFMMDGIIILLGGLLLSRETFVLSILTITAGGVATSLCTLK